MASLTAYALIVRKLLGVGNVSARIPTLLRATVGGIAMGASLPGGQIASAAFWYKQLRREGADRSLSAFALVASMLAGVFSLAALLVVGLAAAGGEARSPPAVYRSSRAAASFSRCLARPRRDGVEPDLARE